MIFEMLSAGIASDLIERTSSTPQVQSALQLSLAPAFLLVAIGSIMNVMMARLNWIAGRIERLEQLPEDQAAARSGECEWLRARRKLASRAIRFSIGAAVVISVVIALLFVSAYIEAKIGTLVALLWVVTVGLLITGLVSFLRETLLAGRGAPQTHS